ncbi:hypothetical protein BT_0471 [Bartonella tribocorum CIP 105476]|uniref:Uncharacterized protein n=1 Tax=Bartonella tribocorum (strain DSM 28219 / CCUG 45778 / CIP 105476 / IBS 506) TaxID=382640 RepID=A9IPG9_BART1|nr:hypothetical protein [Bartonella tribocorum]CAK00926.1 hypothetical protein BT_0471 [Bartonella tribocorum CIP 105476]
MEQNSFNTLSLFMNPKVLRPLIHQGLFQLPKYFFQKHSTPSNTPFEGRYKPSFLERAAFCTNPFDASDESNKQEKVDFSGLIRGSQKGGEVGKKTPAELIMSTDDLKNQMPPLPDYSNYFVKEKEGVEQDKNGISEQKVVETLPSQSSFVANTDKADENGVQQQQKDAMDYIAQSNRQFMTENPQGSSPINEETLSHTPISEEEHLKTNDMPEQATDYVNAVGNFIHKDENPSNLWERFRKSEFSEHLMDFFAGLALGKTPQESFSNASILMRQGNKERAQHKQTLQFLQSKGYNDKDAQAIIQYPDLAMKIIGSTLSPQASDSQKTLEFLRSKGYSNEDAQAVAQYPDLAQKVIGNTLSPQEGYRTLTAEEKAEQGLPEDMAFQVSTSTGKIIPVQGGQRSIASGLGGDADSMLSKPEAGYMLVKDENAPNGIRAMPIAGSGAEHKLIQEQREQEIKNQKIQMQILDTAERSNRILSASKELLKIVEEHPHVTGFTGYWGSFIPGFKAKDFGHMLDSLKANIGIDALRKAKAFSPNGASGFGNLSNMELQTLQNSVAALYQNLSAEQMKKSLKTVIDTFNKSNAATRAILFGGAEATSELVRAAYGEDAYKENNTQSDVLLEKQIEALPEGILFIDSDGRIKEKQTNG